MNDYPISEIESFIMLIMEHVFHFSRTQIHLNQDTEISDKDNQKIIEIVKQLKDYKPIQYTLGTADFYDLKFSVNKNVLVPRQETEELVEWIIEETKTEFPKILDIGTGSGCIAITLAKNISNSQVSAIDISKEALELSKENSINNSTHVDFSQFNILDQNQSLNKKFDIIVSNPPYVTESEKLVMQENVLNYEPHLALFVSNDNPLLFYKAITLFALKHLNPNGKIYFEINEAYGNDVADLLKENHFTDVVIKKDLNNKDRMVRGILK